MLCWEILFAWHTRCFDLVRAARGLSWRRIGSWHGMRRHRQAGSYASYLCPAHFPCSQTKREWGSPNSPRSLGQRQCPALHGAQDPNLKCIKKNPAVEWHLSLSRWFLTFSRHQNHINGVWGTDWALPQSSDPGGVWGKAWECAFLTVPDGANTARPKATFWACALLYPIISLSFPWIFTHNLFHVSVKKHTASLTNTFPSNLV